MTKPETAVYLSKLGYSAEFINGGIVIYTDSVLPHGQKERIRNILRSVCYKGRWGWKIRKPSETWKGKGNNDER